MAAISFAPFPPIPDIALGPDSYSARSEAIHYDYYPNEFIPKSELLSQQMNGIAPSVNAALAIAAKPEVYDAGTYYAPTESVVYTGLFFYKLSTAPAGTTPVDGSDWLKVPGAIPLGIDGQFLSQVSGVPAFANLNAVVGIQRFTLSGTYTRSADVRTVIGIIAQGGQGGSQNQIGASGEVRMFVASPGATESVTIGAGGSGINTTGDGPVGGTTSFGSLASSASGGITLGSNTNGTPPLYLGVPGAVNTGNPGTGFASGGAANPGGTGGNGGPGILILVEFK